MVVGFDGDPDIAALQEQKARVIWKELGGQDLGREPGERWWNHRYDFYYPPQSLKLPSMYGTTESVTTFDKLENLYWAKKAAIESEYADWDVKYIGHFSHWFHWGPASMTVSLSRPRPQRHARPCVYIIAFGRRR